MIIFFYRNSAVIRVLADILRESGKEKVTRIIIAALRVSLVKTVFEYGSFLCWILRKRRRFFFCVLGERRQARGKFAKSAKRAWEANARVGEHGRNCHSFTGAWLAFRVLSTRASHARLSRVSHTRLTRASHTRPHSPKNREDKFCPAPFFEAGGAWIYDEITLFVVYMHHSV